MRRSNYAIIKDSPDMLIIKDLNLGSMSVTNDAKNVVKDLSARLNGRPLYYYDSDGQPGELKYTCAHSGDAEFVSFGPGPGNMGPAH
jgi:hypothetical protein